MESKLKLKMKMYLFIFLQIIFKIAFMFGYVIKYNIQSKKWIVEINNGDVFIYIFANNI